MLLLNRREVERLLDLDRLIEALGPAMAELSARRVSMPARIVSLVPGTARAAGRDAGLSEFDAHAFHEAGERLSLRTKRMVCRATKQ